MKNTLWFQLLITLIAIEDIVMTLEKNGQDYKVLFQGKAGVYHLKHNSKEFDKNYLKLTQSLKTKSKIKIEVDSRSLEIR